MSAGLLDNRRLNTRGAEVLPGFCLLSNHAGELIERKRLKDMEPHSWENSGSFGEEPPLGSSTEAPC